MSSTPSPLVAKFGTYPNLISDGPKWILRSNDEFWGVILDISKKIKNVIFRQKKLKINFWRKKCHPKICFSQFWVDWWKKWRHKYAKMRRRGDAKTQRRRRRVKRVSIWSHKSPEHMVQLSSKSEKSHESRLASHELRDVSREKKTTNIDKNSLFLDRLGHYSAISDMILTKIAPNAQGTCVGMHICFLPMCTIINGWNIT